MVTGTESPALGAMSASGETTADLCATGISAGAHPTEHVRAHLDSLGVLTAAALAGAEAERRVLVGGVVTHRQRGILERADGVVNVVADRLEALPLAAPTRSRDFR